jgi:pantothenate kinase type III
MMLLVDAGNTKIKLSFRNSDGWLECGLLSVLLPPPAVEVDDLGLERLVCIAKDGV